MVSLPGRGTGRVQGNLLFKPSGGTARGSSPYLVSLALSNTDKTWGKDMPPASPRTQRKRPGDLTGVQGQALAAEAARLKAETTTQARNSLEAQRVAKLTDEVDYTSEARQKEREAVEAGVALEGEVEVREKTRRIRVNYPVDDMTFGREVLGEAEFDERGNMTRMPVLGPLRSYTFEEGRWYTVDAELADHLAYLGYIYE